VALSVKVDMVTMQLEPVAPAILASHRPMTSLQAGINIPQALLVRFFPAKVELLEGKKENYWLATSCTFRVAS